jgi:hypothetical protein
VAEKGYIRWYYNISHPYMILLVEGVQVLRPLEREAFDDIVVVQEDGD